MSLKDDYICGWDVVPALFESNAAQSGPVNLGGLRLFGFIMPAAWTTANLTFLVSFDNGATWEPLKSMYDGSEVIAVVGAGGYYPLPDPRLFAAVPMVKLQSGVTGATVNQAAVRTIKLVLRSI
jgi:hypothetical protein